MKKQTGAAWVSRRVRIIRIRTVARLQSYTFQVEQPKTVHYRFRVMLLLRSAAHVRATHGLTARTPDFDVIRRSQNLYDT